MLPRGLFLLAEIAKSCLFSTAETPLQIQRGFPAEVSDVRSAGTRLPTSSLGLQLSQGEKAVYQHIQAQARRAAALLTHTASPDGPTLLQRKRHFHLSVPKKGDNPQTNTPSCSCPLRGFALHTEGFQTARSRVSL